VARNGAPHLDALLRVLDGLVEGRLEDAHALGGDAHAAVVECRTGVTHAGALAPSRFSFVKRQSLKTTSEVWEERSPSVKVLARLQSRCSFRMMKELMPLRPAALSVQQKTR